MYEWLIDFLTIIAVTGSMVYIDWPIIQWEIPKMGNKVCIKYAFMVCNMLCLLRTTSNTFKKKRVCTCNFIEQAYVKSLIINKDIVVLNI